MSLNRYSSWAYVRICELCQEIINLAADYGNEETVKFHAQEIIELMNFDEAMNICAGHVTEDAKEQPQIVRCENCKYCYAEGFGANERNVCVKHEENTQTEPVGDWMLWIVYNLGTPLEFGECSCCGEETLPLEISLGQPKHVHYPGFCRKCLSHAEGIQIAETGEIQVTPQRERNDTARLVLC